MTKKQILIIIVIVIIGVLGILVWQREKPVVENIKEKTITASLDSSFQLKIDQIAIIEGENIKIKFLNVTEDSRCPSDVLCKWEGQITAVVNILKNAQTLGDFSLTSRKGYEDLAINYFDGYFIKLEKVEPYPETTQKIELSDYVVTLVVSSTPLFREEKRITKTGRVYIFGNEPFSEVGLGVDGERTYCLIGSLRKKLWDIQSSVVTIEGYIVDGYFCQSEGKTIYVISYHKVQSERPNFCQTTEDCVLWICAGCLNKDYAKTAPPDLPCRMYEGYFCQCINNQCVEKK